MAKYLIVSSFKSEGIQGVREMGGTAREEAAREAVESLGGTLESYHFAFGEDDAYVIVDMPDNIATAALAIAASSTGMVTPRVVVLLTPGEVDEAVKRNVVYRPPGR